MDTEKDMSRRAFLKDSILAGGSLMLSGILPLKAGNYYNAGTQDGLRTK